MARPAKPKRPARPLVSPEEQATFMEALAGVMPLEGRDRVRVAPPPPKPAVASIVAAIPATVTLAIEGGGEEIGARAPGVNRAQLAELKRGRVRPEATLDLHGKTGAEVTPLLERFLVESARFRRRCVLIVHGRGLHSDDGRAVVRDATIHALLGALSGLVHCLATAAPPDGGPGATYVMVRTS